MAYLLKACFSMLGQRRIIKATSASSIHTTKSSERLVQWRCPQTPQRCITWRRFLNPCSRRTSAKPAGRSLHRTIVSAFVQRIYIKIAIRRCDGTRWINFCGEISLRKERMRVAAGKSIRAVDTADFLWVMAVAAVVLECCSGADVCSGELGPIVQRVSLQRLQLQAHRIPQIGRGSGHQILRIDELLVFLLSLLSFISTSLFGLSPSL